MTDELVTIATFANSFQANLAKGELQGEGIHSVVAGEDPGGTLAFMTSSIGVKLCVRQEDEKASRQVLDELESEGHATQAAIGHGRPRLEVDEDHKEPLSQREQEAIRAFRSAVLGLFFFPLQAYTVWLLLRVYFSEERLETQHRPWAYIAAAIAVPYVLLVLMLIKLLFLTP